MGPLTTHDKVSLWVSVRSLSTCSWSITWAVFHDHNTHMHPLYLTVAEAVCCAVTWSRLNTDYTEEEHVTDARTDTNQGQEAEQKLAM